MENTSEREQNKLIGRFLNMRKTEDEKLKQTRTTKKIRAPSRETVINQILIVDIR